MRTSEPPGKHLTPEEIVLRVFPIGEDPVPVPLHLAACPECQSRVAQLREGFLLDRGATDGMIEAIPEGFWAQESMAIMNEVRTIAAKPQNVLPFRICWNPSVMKRPALALGSLAAALLVMASLTLYRYQSATPPVLPAAASSTMNRDGLTTEMDRQDDELLVSIDQALLEQPYGVLIPEDV